MLDAPPPRTLVRRAALALFLVVAGVLLLTSGGHTYTVDEEQMFRTAGSLVLRGSFAIGAEEDGTEELSKYGPAQPILVIPLFLAGHAIAQAFPPEAYNFVIRAMAVWFNPFVTAAVAAMVLVVAARLGYGVGVGAATALIYVFGTTAWPHSKTFFAEPLTALLFMAPFALLLRRDGEPPLPTWRLALAGALAGLAVPVKIQAGLALPILGLWLLWQEWTAEGGRAGVGRALRAGLIWGLCAVALVSLQPFYQWLVFRSAVRSGYADLDVTFTHPLLVGLYGLLFSSGKGLIWYAPPLVLAPWGLWLLWRRHAGAAALCAAMVVAHLLFYAIVIFWHGDVAWGPRYLNTILPFLALPLAPIVALAAHGAGTPRRGARAALALTLAAALPAQLGGMTISMNAYVSVQRDEPTRIWVPDQAPILGHLRLLEANLRGLYDLHLAPNSLALRGGFWFSEGDRRLDPAVPAAQLPRWTLPRAELAIRPPAGQPTVLRLDLTSCWARPAPTSVTIVSDGRAVAQATLCPARRYALLLPPGPRSVWLEATTWDPVRTGVDREGPLGIAVTGASAQSGDTVLALKGDLVPPPPAPPGRILLRRWFSDHRFGHWDHWAWFFVVSGFPAAPLAGLAALWLVVSLGMITAGVALALRLRREAGGGARREA